MGSEPQQGEPEREPAARDGAPAPSHGEAAQEEGTAQEEAAQEEAAQEEAAEAADAEQRYITDLIARGEAVPEGEELPPGATHEIVEDESGRKTVRRKRFSAY